MKKRIVAVLLSAAMIFTMAPVSPVSAAPEDGDNSVPAVQVDAENPGNNIALKATADASYTNTYGISPASMRVTSSVVLAVRMWTWSLGWRARWAASTRGAT